MLLPLSGRVLLLQERSALHSFSGDSANAALAGSYVGGRLRLVAGVGHWEAMLRVWAENKKRTRDW